MCYLNIINNNIVTKDHLVFFYNCDFDYSFYLTPHIYPMLFEKIITF